MVQSQDPSTWPAAWLHNHRALLDALVPWTVERAAKEVPFYQRHWKGAWRKVKTAQDLWQLPVLRKQDAVAQQHALLASSCGVGSYAGVISSGTQHGDRRPLRVARIPQERDALAAFLDHPARPPVPPTTSDPGMVLELRSMQHGLPDAPPPLDVLRLPWAFTANTFRLVEELLTHPQPNGRRITGLLLGAGAIMPVTSWFLEKDVDPRTFGITEIGTTGFRLSRFWRDVVEDAWGAPVFDNFSLSEFTTPALSCQHCGFNHWLDPPVVAEVVDPVTTRPVAAGSVGVLVLTGLFPFVQAMPLIRYWTGDLVEQGPPCPESALGGIRWLGRHNQTPTWRPAAKRPLQTLVAPVDLVDFLESSPQVGRIPHPVQTLGLIKSQECGPPRYTLRFDAARPPSITVAVELRFDPRIHLEAALAFANALEAHLHACAPALRRSKADLQVDLFGPGQLAATWSKF